MKTALFLGAGASVFVGLPTTEKLMDLVRERVREREGVPHGDHNGQSYIMRIINSDIYTDIEKLYDGLEQVVGITKNTNCKPIIGEADSYNDTYKAIIDDLTGLQSTIRKVLLDSFNIDEKFYGTIGHVYNQVWEAMKYEGADVFQVFTTNYDLVMEEYCKEENLEVVNGFVSYRHLSRNWYNAWTSDTSNPVYLVKLHGSINWHRDDDEIVEIGGVKQRSADNDIIIAPTEGSKRYDNTPFSALMDRFRREIKNVNVLLVIGFSYRDEAIVRIIKDRLANGMTLISVSPSAEADIRRVCNAKPTTRNVDGLNLKIVNQRIILCEEKFEPNTIHDVIALLMATYKFIKQSGTRLSGMHWNPS